MDKAGGNLEREVVVRESFTRWELFLWLATAQKNEVVVKDFFSKCDQIRMKLRIRPHLPKRFLMKNFIFCEMNCLKEPMLTYAGNFQAGVIRERILLKPIKKQDNNM